MALIRASTLIATMHSYGLVDSPASTLNKDCGDSPTWTPKQCLAYCNLLLLLTDSRTHHATLQFFFSKFNGHLQNYRMSTKPASLIFEWPKGSSFQKTSTHRSMGASMHFKKLLFSEAIDCKFLLTCPISPDCGLRPIVCMPWEDIYPWILVIERSLSFTI